VNRIKQIVVHSNPHLDELVAVWLLRNFGEEKFPEISKATLVVWGRKELAQMSPEMAAMNGILFVGIGGGMFDEHIGKGQRDDCAATLVAKYLGVMETPELKRFLMEIYQTDSNIDGPQKCLADEVQNLNRYWTGSLDLEKLYRQIEPSIIVRIERQKEYLTAKDRFNKCYRKRIGNINLVAVDGLDNCQFQHVARTGGANLIIQRNRAGLTQILTGKVNPEDVDMVGLAIRVRKTEIVKSGLRPRHFVGPDELSKTGTLDEIPQWYFEKGLLLNGSESFLDVPPSGIQFGDLVHLVERHLIESQRPKGMITSQE
jgi:hypothetical protein